MNIKKLAAAAIIATTSFAAHAMVAPEGASAESQFKLVDAVQSLASCKTVESCKKAGNDAARAMAVIADESTKYQRIKAGTISMIVVMREMHKMGRVSDSELMKFELQALSEARKQGVSINLSEIQ